MTPKNIDDFKVEKKCKYKDYEYLVRDNGAIYRIVDKPNTTPWIKGINNIWSFGRKNTKGTYSIGAEEVHRIVATAFLGVPLDEHYVVLHIDGDKYNNQVSNLRWVTMLEYVLTKARIRKTIEDDTHVDINTFIDDPYSYKELIKSPEIVWIKDLINQDSRIERERISEWLGFG